MLKHKAGVSNREADALSSRHGLISNMRMTVPGFEILVDLYPTDPFFAKVLWQIQYGERTYFMFWNRFLFHGLQLCIPDCILHLKIIQELHNKGHVGRDRTFHLVSSSYFCPTMRNRGS